MIYGVVMLVLCGLFGDVLAYVPDCQPLMPVLIEFIRLRPAIKSQSFGPVRIEERDGFACIDGVDAFEQAVVQASHARPVMVFFFAQRDEQSQNLWENQEMKDLVQELGCGQGKKADFVAVNIFPSGGEELATQNYQIAMRCMASVGMASMPLPVIVFFKDGLMCSSPPAILTGAIRPARIKQVMQKLLADKQSKL